MRHNEFGSTYKRQVRTMSGVEQAEQAEQVDREIYVPTTTDLMWPAFTVLADDSQPIDVNTHDSRVADLLELSPDQIEFRREGKKDTLFRERMRLVRTHLKKANLIDNRDVDGREVRGTWKVAVDSDNYPANEEELLVRHRRASRQRREDGKAEARSAAEADSESLRSEAVASETPSKGYSAGVADRVPVATTSQVRVADSDDPLIDYITDRAEKLRREVTRLNDEQLRLRRELERAREGALEASGEFELLRQQLDQRGVAIAPLEF